jgi:hypothetical protein
VPLNTEQKDARTQAEHKAIMAILNQISEGKATFAGTLQLAEAYAWLTSPSQPHGG